MKWITLDIIVCIVPLILIILSFLTRFFKRLQQEELQRQLDITYLNRNNSSPLLLQQLIKKSIKYQNTWGKIFSFKFNLKAINTLKLIAFIPVTILTCLLLELTIRMSSTYFGTNELYPKHDSESIRFFCNCVRIVGIIFSSIVFIPSKHKKVGFILGFIYFISSFFLPSEIHLGELTIVIYKGFTSYIGGIFGMIVAIFIIICEDAFYDDILRKKPL
ncbi:hypothetical protein [Flavobacterium sp.]|uniref:hypothetical protein n=1 Tax=Flavobacterium sp. TaxID=239 RepID=UPI003D0E38EF